MRSHEISYNTLRAIKGLIILRPSRASLSLISQPNTHNVITAGYHKWLSQEILFDYMDILQAPKCEYSYLICPNMNAKINIDIQYSRIRMRKLIFISNIREYECECSFIIPVWHFGSVIVRNITEPAPVLTDWMDEVIIALNSFEKICRRSRVVKLI